MSELASSQEHSSAANAADERQRGGLVSDSVLTDVVEGVLVVTINRPEARNAINTETAVAIGEAMDRLDDDRSLVAGVAFSVLSVMRSRLPLGWWGGWPARRWPPAPGPTRP